MFLNLVLVSLLKYAVKKLSEVIRPIPIQISMAISHASLKNKMTKILYFIAKNVSCIGLYVNCDDYSFTVP